MKTQSAITLTLIAVSALALTACMAAPAPSAPQPAAETPAQIANPASKNCIAQGGMLVIEERGELGQSELAAVEPNVSAQATPATLPAQLMDETVQRLLLDALYATPQGVLRMSDAVPGLVETSTNIGIVDAAAGKLAASFLLRSSVDTALDDVGQMIASVWDMAGVAVDASGRYAGWRPNPESSIVLLMQDAYREQTGQDAVVSAVHAGLECGTIVSKYPGMDAISIGPTLYDVHTPSERLEIATVPKLMDLLMETLQRIPAQ